MKQLTFGSSSRNNERYFDIFNGVVHKLDKNCIYYMEINEIQENIDEITCIFQKYYFH